MASGLKQVRQQNVAAIIYSLQEQMIPPHLPNYILRSPDEIRAKENKRHFLLLIQANQETCPDLSGRFPKFTNQALADSNLPF